MSKRKLLLADDSVTIQKVVNLTFADEGIEVVAVGDGNSAISAFAASEPDIVLADVNMPGLSGYEVCEHIRRGSVKANVPVILLVGSFEQFDQSRAAQAGANAHITKPFQSIRQLVTMVTEMLADSAAPISVGAPAAAEGFPQAATASNLSDELIDSYIPDTVRFSRPEAHSDDILEGSELDSLLRGRPQDSPVNLADDFNILEIPAEPAGAPRAVQPERAAPVQPQTEQFTSGTNPFATEVVPGVMPNPSPNRPASSNIGAAEISPEVIEMIAARLAEKISEDAVREIAHRIVPEVTAMIIKKMVEQASKS